MTRIVLSGTLPNGEIWSTGFFMSNVTATSPAQLSILAQHVATVLYDGATPNGMFSVMTKLCNSQTTWTTTTAYYYGAGGNKSTMIGSYTWPTAKVGSLQNGVPEQCAVVISLRTALAGRSHRGRMYMPATGASLQLDGQLISTVVDELAAGWAHAFLQLMDGTVHNVGIVSDVQSTYTPIFSVKVDSKIDTMRSRSKSASVDHVAVNAVYP